MKAWNFQVGNSLQEITSKLESGLGSADSFIFNLDKSSDDALRFGFRKRVFYPDQILHRNRIVISGKVEKSGSENSSNVEISFDQHLFTKLIIGSFFALGLVCLVLAIPNEPKMFAPAGIGLGLGFGFWFRLRQKFETDIEKYKVLISEILEC